MLAQAKAAPSNTTSDQDHIAPGARTQTRPAAVLAFPQRNSNYARACVAGLDVSPAVRLTGYTIADMAAVHSQPMTYRQIRAGDCASFPSGATIRRKRPGPKVCPGTVQNHVNALVAAGLERRRTIHTNTYIFTPPEQPRKAPEIRAEIAQNCDLFSSLDSCLKEPRTEPPRREEDPPPPPPRATVALRKTCTCGNSWPAEYGDDCHDCKRADREADREERRRRRRRERRDRRRQPLPKTVIEQIARTDRSQPIRGCPASVQKARIDTLELSLEQWRSRSDPAKVEAWERELRELRELTAAAAADGRDPTTAPLQPVTGNDTIGQMALTTAERQRRFRERRRAAIPVKPRPPESPTPRRKPRPARWTAALEELRTLQAEYVDWRDGLPAALVNSRTAGLLDDVCDVDLDALDVKLPRGYGRD